MSAYTPGLYRTLGGKVYHYNGSSWNPFKSNFKEFEEDFETWDVPEPEMIKLGADTEKITLIKEWWAKTSRIEGVDISAMIDLGEILMKED